MLSKSQARTFFLGGTVVTFAAFIALTIYSFRPSNDQANTQNIDPQVVRGKEIWEANNCMGCHTIFGEGGYYAPELTKVIDRKGADMIRAILRSPVAWGSNGRKMVAYGMNEEDTEAMIAYFQWAGEVDLNGFETVVSPLSKKDK